MKQFFYKNLPWFWKNPEPPPLKQEINHSVDESREKRIEKLNKMRKNEGYLCCHGCGRSTALFRMTLHKRNIVKGNKKKKVYFCGDCLPQDR